MSTENGPVVIDLGFERGEPESYSSPRRSTTPVWFPAAMLAALVLLCSSASAAPARSPLSPVFSLPVGPADAYALTDSGQLLAQTFGTLASYELRTGRLRWQAGQSTPAYRLRLGDGVVLMRPWMVGAADPGTTAISIATGVSLWERPGRVVTLAGSSALLAVSSVPGAGGVGRRVQGSVDAVDPATGGTRWTVQVPSTAVLLGLPGSAEEDARMILVHDDRTLAVHDLDTGRLLASTMIPAADYNPDNPVVVAGGQILLRHPGARDTEISAYDSVTLRQRWTEPAGDAYEIVPCGALACVAGSDGVRAIDPATGDRRWTRPHWRDVEQYGTMIVAYRGAEQTDLVGIIDPRTGAVRVALDGWRPVTGSGGGGHLLVTRAVEAGARTMVAVARPDEPQPRLLADLPAGTGDCQAVPARLVCRSMYGELVVWAYRL